MSALVLAIRRLLAVPAVATAVDHQVFPVRVPSGAVRPYLSVTLVSEAPMTTTLEGASIEHDARVSVAVLADTATQADAIGELIKAALGNLLLVDVELPNSPPEPLGTIVNSSKLGADALSWSTDGTVFQRAIDFEIRWRGAP